MDTTEISVALGRREAALDAAVGRPGVTVGYGIGGHPIRVWQRMSRAERGRLREIAEYSGRWRTPHGEARTARGWM